MRIASFALHETHMSIPIPPSKHAFRRLCSQNLRAEKPAATSAPKQNLPLKHIRENVELYERNCLERNYKVQSKYPARIASLFQQWKQERLKGRSLRERSKLLQSQIAEADASLRSTILEEARKLKEELSLIEKAELAMENETQVLAAAIPNLTDDCTPRGDEFKLIDNINDHPDPTLSSTSRRSHLDIGNDLNLIDLPSAATVSGSGWYYLLNEGALLEQALIQYAIQTALSSGFQLVSPPSLVYSHIGSACGFQPRDLNDEQQIYRIAQVPEDRRPELSLAGTAEIPLAGMKANTVIEESELPILKVAVSRSYRAEAGAHGLDTRGLYRVHEFTKVELFAWTLPDHGSTTETFNTLVAVQKDILSSLGLHCRVLEMPSTDLGSSAYRKWDIEAFFPSRRTRNEGWGEVTSTSICTDYQTRRLGTRVRMGKEVSYEYPYTVNGTAMAVPRVLAALLENGWNEAEGTVMIPKVLRPFMGGKEKIGPKKAKEVVEHEDKVKNHQ